MLTHINLYVSARNHTTRTLLHVRRLLLAAAAAAVRGYVSKYIQSAVEYSSIMILVVFGDVIGQNHDFLTTHHCEMTCTIFFLVPFFFFPRTPC